MRSKKRTRKCIRSSKYIAIALSFTNWTMKPHMNHPCWGTKDILTLQLDLEQNDITLNMLQSCTTSPKLLA
ncbi:LOW QUALITY PROTEIN: hypothetical protein ACHAW6_008723 [Cyclotella cf. meneghiniana]